MQLINVHGTKQANPLKYSKYSGQAWGGSEGLIQGQFDSLMVKVRCEDRSRTLNPQTNKAWLEAAGMDEVNRFTTSVIRVSNSRLCA